MNKAAELSRYRALAALGYTYAVSGERGRARQALAGLQEMARHRYASPVDFVVIYTGLGEFAALFGWRLCARRTLELA